jgi:hypothetical protein
MSATLADPSTRAAPCFCCCGVLSHRDCMFIIVSTFLDHRSQGLAIIQQKKRGMNAWMQESKCPSAATQQVLDIHINHWRQRIRTYVVCLFIRNCLVKHDSRASIRGLRWGQCCCLFALKPHKTKEWACNRGKGASPRQRQRQYPDAAHVLKIGDALFLGTHTMFAVCAKQKQSLWFNCATLAWGVEKRFRMYTGLQSYVATKYLSMA